MDRVVFKQEKPLKAKIVAGIFLAFGFFALFEESAPLSKKTILFVLALLVFGYSISYEIRKDFNNRKVISFFGVPVLKFKFIVDFPDYISVFSASFKQENEWSTVSALGTRSKFNSYVIRLFSGNKNTTIYKTNNYEVALSKAKELNALLDVEIHDSVNV